MPKKMEIKTYEIHMMILILIHSLNGNTKYIIKVINNTPSGFSNKAYLNTIPIRFNDQMKIGTIDQ